MNEDYTKDRIDDHEERIRTLEKNDAELKIQWNNMEKSQTEIKLMVTEQGKEQLKMYKEQTKMFNDFTASTLQFFQSQSSENNKTNNTIKIQDRKEFWIIVSAIVTGLLTYFGLK